jgi:DNA-binding NarL/FixJ family response regulator
MVMPHNGEKTFHDLMALDPDVKVLITSGYAEDHRIRLLIRQGAKGFIQKPFSVNVLKKKILRAIS